MRLDGASQQRVTAECVPSIENALQRSSDPTPHCCDCDSPIQSRDSPSRSGFSVSAPLFFHSVKTQFLESFTSLFCDKCCRKIKFLTFELLSILTHCTCNSAVGRAKSERVVHPKLSFQVPSGVDRVQRIPRLATCINVESPRVRYWL